MVRYNFYLEQLYGGCDETRRFPSAIAQAQNAAFHAEQSISSVDDDGEHRPGHGWGDQDLGYC